MEKLGWEDISLVFYHGNVIWRLVCAKRNLLPNLKKKGTKKVFFLDSTLRNFFCDDTCYLPIIYAIMEKRRIACTFAEKKT